MTPKQKEKKAANECCKLANQRFGLLRVFHYALTSHGFSESLASEIVNLSKSMSLDQAIKVIDSNNGVKNQLEKLSRICGREFGDDVGGFIGLYSDSIK